MKKNKENIRAENDRRNSEPEENKGLPGNYPPSEDIMNRMNKVERTGIDPDHLTRTPGAPSMEREDSEDVFPPSRGTHIVTKGPADLNKEDYEALGPRDLSLDGGDDEQLKHRTWPVDFTARDIDIPGSELDDRNEAIGSEDEENNSYSLGGDEKDSLEDDPTRTFG
ncbi:MAG TPA: hypothetical protein VD884_02815, partial [Ohtaekwangia sp.]|nr:hypothetical protein [Ohtaekwangia sp.]